MKKTLKVRLNTIVNQLNPVFRIQGKRDISLLLNNGVSSYEDLLFVLLNTNEKVELREIAAWAIARLNDQQGFPTLLAALDDLIPEVRVAAACSLAEFGGEIDNIAIDSLMRKLYDDDIRVQIAAVYGLGLLGDKSAGNPLVEILLDKNNDPKLRGMSAEALADIKDLNAINPLIKVLKDKSTEVRYWASFALGELGAKEALPELKRLADTDDTMTLTGESVKKEAAAAIRAIWENGFGY